MKLFYDFHLHTALSPCADDCMTPNNIVNMSALLGLDCIAITDHNSYLNVESCIEAAKNNNLDIIVIPGMEVETSEEIHVICLFSELHELKKFGGIIEDRLNKIKNNEKIFGPQIILDSMDNEIGHYENLLLTSVSIDIYELVSLAKEYNGIAIPAHIDRNSYSIITNLGFIPEDLDINLVEFSKNGKPDDFLGMIKKTAKKDFGYITSSDSHYLEHMMEAKNFLEFEKFPSKSDIIKKLKDIKKLPT